MVCLEKAKVAICWRIWVSFANTLKALFETFLFRLQKIDGIVILGKPEVSVIALESHVFDIYQLSSMLAARDWNLTILQYPSG